jgi:hypothetical protein
MAYRYSIDDWDVAVRYPNKLSDMFDKTVTKYPNQFAKWFNTGYDKVDRHSIWSVATGRLLASDVDKDYKKWMREEQARKKAKKESFEDELDKAFKRAEAYFSKSAKLKRARASTKVLRDPKKKRTYDDIDWHDVAQIDAVANIHFPGRWNTGPHVPVVMAPPGR